jgi:hypothetical protein
MIVRDCEQRRPTIHAKQIKMIDLFSVRGLNWQGK